MMEIIYRIVKFVIDNRWILGAALVFIGFLELFLPWLEKRLRPSDYVYVGWGVNTSSETGAWKMFAYQRYLWPHDGESITVSISKHEHIHRYSWVVVYVLYPTHMDDMHVRINGDKPPMDRWPDMDVLLDPKDLGEFGYELECSYLEHGGKDNLNYRLQGIALEGPPRAQNIVEIRRISVSRGPLSNQSISAPHGGVQSQSGEEGTGP